MKCHKMDLKLNDDKYIHHLLFADNEIIIDDEATYMLHKLKETYEEWGLKINMNKTEHLLIHQKTDILLNNTSKTPESRPPLSICHASKLAIIQRLHILKVQNYISLK